MTLYFVAISLLFVLPGVGMTLWGLYKVRRAICSESWPSTTGTITHSELVEQWEEVFDMVAYHWEPKITCTYMVDGKKLHKQMTLSLFDLKSSAQRHLNQYPLNSTVKVYYNLTDPSDADLNPGPPIEIGFTIIGGVGLIIIGVSLIIYI